MRHFCVFKELKNEENFCCWPLAVGRWPLAVGMMCVISGFAARPAHAWWQIDVEQTGTSKTTWIGSDGNEEEQVLRLEDEFIIEAIAMTSYWCDSGNPVTAEMDATFKVKATWVANNPNDKPPYKNWFKITAMSYAQGDGSGGSADNDMPDDFVNLHSGWYGIPTAEKIVQKTGDATEYDLGTYTLNPKATAVAVADDDDNFYTYYATAMCLVGAETADRGLSISRSGAHDERVEANGDVHGDTIYTYEQEVREFEGAPLTRWEKRVNWQNFVANLGGAWTEHEVRIDGIWVTETQKGTDHQWSPSRDHVEIYNEGYRKGAYKMSDGGLNHAISDKWVGTSKGVEEKTITFTAKDNNGSFSANATYILRVHDPVDEISKDTYAVSYETDYFDNGSPLVASQNPIDAGKYTITRSVSNGVSIVGTIGDIGAFKMPLGLEFGYEHSRDHGIEKQTPSNPVVLESGEYINVVVKHTYNRHHTTFYKYDAGGKQKRLVDPIGPPPITGWEEKDKVEVPHEGIADSFSDEEILWSEVRRDNNGGRPTSNWVQPTLPPPSYKYSKNGGKHEKPAV